MKHSFPLFFFFLVLLFSATSSTPFTCSTKSMCQSLVDYTSPNATTLLQLKTLFNLSSIPALLSINNLPLNTSSSYRVPPNSTTRIGFTCKCTANGTGVPVRPPTYKVKAGDGLDFIARTIFGGLVTYQEIAAFSNVTDPNLIVVGQELKIPLPCGCDDVDGMKVVHYGHVVEAGASLEGIGSRFGVDEKVLLSVNGLKSPKELIAGQVLDVPLRACSSSISGTSRDHNLLVPNASSVLTANGCVQCSCSSTSWQLDCRSAQMVPSKSCLAAKCGNLFLGDTLNVTACKSSTCTYTGYINSTILTNLASQSSCNISDGVPISQPTGGAGWRYKHGGFLIFLEMMLIMLACVF